MPCPRARPPLGGAHERPGAVEAERAEAAAAMGGQRPLDGAWRVEGGKEGAQDFNVMVGGRIMLYFYLVGIARNLLSL